MFNADLIDHLYLKDSFGIPKNIIYKQDNIVNKIWDDILRINSRATIDLSKEIEAFKNDIIMSVYSSILYTTINPTSSDNLFNSVRNIDPALSNRTSEESEKNYHNKRKSDLRKDFAEPILLSGQIFDNNALLYLSGYWNENNNAFKSFNDLDFYYYIKSYTKWPFHPDNLNGMFFNEYFSGVQDMFQCRLSTDLNQLNAQQKLDTIVSSYIFEELFHPCNFIQNLSDFLSVFSNIFGETNTPSREQAISLIRPLFKVAPSLQSFVKSEYYSSIKRYIEDPRNIENVCILNTILDKTLFYQNFLYPYLQSAFSFSIYHAFNGDLDKIKEILAEYIISRLDDFNYFNTVNNHFDILNKQMFPATGKKSYNINAKTKDKRSNLSILSFEINYTFNFYCRPHMPNFFEHFRIYRNTNTTIQDYISLSKKRIMTDIASINSSISTANYLNFTLGNKAMFWGTME